MNKLYNALKTLNLTLEQRNELVKVLSELGGGGEDKVFEIKIRMSQFGVNSCPEIMINGIGWFSSSTSKTENSDWRIDRLNGEPWEIKDEAVREIFKDIESYNKLKLTYILTLGDTEMPISSIEELTYQLLDAYGEFGLVFFSKVHRNPNGGYFLSVNKQAEGGFTAFLYLGN